MAMFPKSRDIRILGGNLVSVNKGDVHFHMDAIPGQRGWDLLQKNIAPGASHDAAERPDPPRCYPRTRQSILTRIMAWIKDLDTQQLVLWLYGPAASGKTAITQTIAEMCEEAGILAASFFFSRLAAGRSNKTHLFSTMASELFIMIPEIRCHIESAVAKDPLIFSRSLATQMQKLIVAPLNAAAVELSTRGRNGTPPPRLVIMDGLDECSDYRAQREILETISKCARQLSYPLVFLVASRPEYEIREAFNTKVLKSLTLAIALDNTYHPDDDIKIFLQSKFDENKEKHPLRDDLPTPWPNEEDMDHLVKKASGQFIYASTVMKYIESHRHHPMKRLKIVLGLSNQGNDTPFAELDALYHHIFLSVEGIEKILKVLALLLLGSEYQPWLKVSFTELLLEYEADDVQTIFSDMHTLVHVPKAGDRTDALQIHHASLRDFLLDRSRSKQFFIKNKRNLRMLEGLCGKDTMSNVRMVTTDWGRVSEQEGRDREAGLASGASKPLIDAGALQVRQDNDLKAARSNMSHFIPKDAVRVKIEDGAALNATGAGVVINEKLKELLPKHKVEMVALEKELEESAREKGETLKAELADERKELEKEMARAEADRERLEKMVLEERLRFDEGMKKAEQDRLIIERGKTEMQGRLQDVQRKNEAELAEMREAAKKMADQIKIAEEERARLAEELEVAMKKAELVQAIKKEAAEAKRKAEERAEEAAKKLKDAETQLNSTKPKADYCAVCRGPCNK